MVEDDERITYDQETLAERDRQVQEARRRFHALWGRAAMPNGGYKKEEWTALQSLLSDLLGTAV